MTLRMLVDGLHAEETRMVIADDDQLIEFDIESSFKKQNKGNIYLAKVTRVEPSLQAAFVEYGSGRQGFLPFSEIHPDYYQIPVADKQELLQAQADIREEEQRKIEEELERESTRGQKPEGEAAQANDTGLEGEVVASEEVSEIEHSAPDFGGDESHSEEHVPTEEGLTLSVASLQGDEPMEAHHEEHHEPMEELGGDDHLEDRPKRSGMRRYKIQEVIKKNQIVLIQVIKEERGNKGASVTSYISLPGRYCILMPNTNRGGGVSRKISDIKERKKLKEVVEGLEIKDGMSIIIRTAGMGRTKPDIARDYSYLIKLWNKIREDTLSSSAPALVYEEGNIIKRGLRDFYSNDMKEVLVSGEKAFETARDFMKLIMPTHSKKIIQYEDQIPVFNKFGIEKQLMSMNDSVVTLASGGYIVINTTEALISIDVNSGRATGERNVEDTATRTNIDAAHEIARQLRLRDLAGLIVIDFIDMLDSRHRRSVERNLKDALKADRAKIQVGRISPFGLLEMSRQRLRPSLTEIHMVECPGCKGTGIIRTPDSSMIQLARAIENELAVAQSNGVKVVKAFVTASPTLALYFLNHKRKHIAELEARYNFELVVEVADMFPSAFTIQLEDDNGGKSRLVSSEDRDSAKLPQSRGDGKSGSKRSRGGRGRDRAPGAAGGEQRRDGKGPRGQRPERERNETVHDEEKLMEKAIDRLENEGGETEPLVGENGEQRPRRRRRNRNRNRRREPRVEGAEGTNPEHRDNASGESDGYKAEEIVTSGSFAPTTPRPPRAPRTPREDRPAREPREPRQPREEAAPAQAEAAASNDDAGGEERKAGWWRKIIE